MKAIRFVAVGALLALAACSKPAATDKPAEAAATPAKPPLVTVNGKPISQKLFEEYAKASPRKPVERAVARGPRADQGKPRPRRTHRAAGREGRPDQGPGCRHAPRARRGSKLIQQAAAQKYLKDHTPTEAELRAEFESQLASAPLIEYQARHILVSSEDVAQKIIAQLKAGNDFAALAKRMSSRQGVRGAKAATSAGSRPRDMDPAFTDAVALLKKGEFTKTPGADRSPAGT